MCLSRAHGTRRTAARSNVDGRPTPDCFGSTLTNSKRRNSVARSPCFNLGRVYQTYRASGARTNRQKGSPGRFLTVQMVGRRQPLCNRRLALATFEHQRPPRFEKIFASADEDSRTMVEANSGELQSTPGFYAAPDHRMPLCYSRVMAHPCWRFIRLRACSGPWIPATRLRGYRHRGHDAINSAVVTATAVIPGEAGIHGLYRNRQALRASSDDRARVRARGRSLCPCPREARRGTVHLRGIGSRPATRSTKDRRRGSGEPRP